MENESYYSPSMHNLMIAICKQAVQDVKNSAINAEERLTIAKWLEEEAVLWYRVLKVGVPTEKYLAWIRPIRAELQARHDERWRIQELNGGPGKGRPRIEK